MKKTLIGLAALPLATFAIEASAQTNMNANGAMGVQNRIAMLESRVNAGIQQGAISGSEANMLRNRLAQLRNLERRYSRNGLTQNERRDLQQRIRSVRDQVRTAYGRGYAWNDSSWDSDGYTYGNNGYGNNGYGNNGYVNNGYGNNGYVNNGVRYDQYGRPIQTGGVTYDQYGRPMQTGRVTYDQYGRPVASNGVVYDQNGRVIQGVTYDQYGRPVVTGGYSNGYYGQGGPYEPVQQRSGVGGVLGSVLGGALGGGSGVGGVLGSVLGGRSLGVGDVITSAIGSLLRGGSSYGSQYRDNNRTYFRSDGQQVYEIDARTNQVVRIHPLR